MPDLTALAIDLGGSHAACGVVRDGTILASRILPADGSGSLAELLPKLADVLFELLTSAQIDKSDCSALVLGFCGIVSARENRVLDTNGSSKTQPAWTFLSGVKKNLDFLSLWRTMPGWLCWESMLLEPLVGHKTQ